MKTAIVVAIVATMSLPTHLIAQQGPAPAAGSSAAAPGAVAPGAAAAAAPVAALAPNVALLLGAGALIGVVGLGGNSANTPAADRPMPTGRLTPRGRPFTDPTFNPTTTTITTNTTITTAPGSF